jgi:hypothetical protein
MLRTTRRYRVRRDGSNLRRQQDSERDAIALRVQRRGLRASERQKVYRGRRGLFQNLRSFTRSFRRSSSLAITGGRLSLVGTNPSLNLDGPRGSFRRLAFDLRQSVLQGLSNGFGNIGAPAQSRGVHLCRVPTSPIPCTLIRGGGIPVFRVFLDESLMFRAQQQQTGRAVSRSRVSPNSSFWSPDFSLWASLR